jgi:uncharacterized protein with FMN-binding domain
MPKRGAITTLLTAIGVALLINFKTPSQQGLAAFGAHTAVATGQPSTTSGTSASTGPTPSSGTTATDTPQPTAAASKTYTGPAINYYFGTAQVQVTIANGQISSVVALQLPNEGQSAWISQQVEPMLRSEVLSVQSANIDLISGATYTSQAYIQSLQGALDKAHA